MLPNWAALGLIVVGGLALASASLLYRIWSDIIEATRLTSDDVPSRGGSTSADE